MPDDSVVDLRSMTFTPFVPDWDESDPDISQSTYFGAEHGPHPVPDWVITDDAAHQIERGILKTGKEADVHLVERRLGDRCNLLAAKRYRPLSHREFRDDSRYRRARSTGNRRTDLAMAKGTRAGVAFRAEQWVANEFDVLGRLWSAGASVPYPVQRSGDELMMEYLGDDERAAPRLVHARLDVGQAADLFAQAVANLEICAAQGVVHGDLSPYNMLVWGDRLVLIDFPQAVDPIAHPDGLRLLERDVANLCQWGRREGVACDPGEILRGGDGCRVLTEARAGRLWVMPTPVGPVPRDPNDPDLWDEWYDGDADEQDDDLGPGFGWPLRIVALVIVVGIVALFVLAG